MSLTFSQTPGNGVTVSFPITLEGGYFDNDDILVEFITIATGAVEEISDTLYEISSGNVIFDTAPPNTVEVRIRRFVSNENTYSDFTRGNAFGADNLNDSFSNALYQLQQLADGFRPDDFYWKSNTNAGFYKLINLAEGTADTDAVNYGQISPLITAFDSIESAVDEAEASAAAALTSETNASTSETNAASYANSANNYQILASTYRDSALTYRDQASVSATAASNAADRAEAAAGSVGTDLYHREWIIE